MSTISIQDLNPIGIDLLCDRETFLNELDDTEQNLTKGGVTPVAASILAVGAGAAAGYQISKAAVNIVEAVFF